MTTIIAKWLLDNATRGSKIKHGIAQTAAALDNVSMNNIGRRNRSKQAQQKGKAPGGPPSSISNLRPCFYVPLARDIVRQAPRRAVPTHIVDAIRNAIKFRRVVCSWFSTYTEEEIVDSNKSHLAFVRILQDVHDTLAPLKEVSEPLSTSDDSVQAEIDTVENLFDVLQRFDKTDDHCDRTPDESHIVPNTMPDGQASVAADPLSDDDSLPPKSRALYRRVSAAKCFLYDIGGIQTYVRDKWTAFVNGQIPLAVVAGLTNLAIELVDRLEDDFYASFEGSSCDPGEVLLESSLPRLLAQSTNGKAHPEGESAIPQSNYQIADDGVFDIPNWTVIANGVVQRARARIMNMHNTTNVLSQLMDEMSTAMANGQYDRTVNADSADGQCQTLKMSKPAPGHVHKFEPASPLSILSLGISEGLPYMEELEAILGESLSRCDQAKSCHTNSEDMVVQILRKAVEEDWTRCSTAFAVAVFMDIRTKVKDTNECLQAADAAAGKFADSLTKSLAMKVHFEACVCPEYLTGQRKVTTAFTDFGHNIQSGAGAIGHCCKEELYLPVQKNVRGLLAQSPLACGSLCLWLHSSRMDNVLRRASEQGFLLAWLHFYNAALHCGETCGKWEDMEFLISHLGAKKVFMGARPDSLEECLSVMRLVFRIDMRLDAVYKGRKDISRALSKSSEKNDLAGGFAPFCFLLNALHGQAVGLGGIPSSSLEDLEFVLLAQVKVPNIDTKLDYDGKIMDREVLQKRMRRYGPMTNLQLLEATEKRM